MKLPQVERVVVTKNWISILMMQVCAVDDATDEEILAVCNRDSKLHGAARWSRVIRGSGPDDPPDAAPGPCADSAGRTHFLVVW